MEGVGTWKDRGRLWLGEGRAAVERFDRGSILTG